MAKFEYNELILLWFLTQNEFYFEWDDGNSEKSKAKHGITCEEIESVFRLNPKQIRVLGNQVSPVYDSTEERYGLFGKTETGKSLFICVTLREDKTKIRVISAREVNKKEQISYDNLLLIDLESEE
ncbi:MAG: BrnT family toxin [Silvanigrellaceae bacterium]|nr:BrnT family toxin [Silvanigrellaceae bacterium]